MPLPLKLHSPTDSKSDGAAARQPKARLRWTPALHARCAPCMHGHVHASGGRKTRCLLPRPAHMLTATPMSLCAAAGFWRPATHWAAPRLQRPSRSCCRWPCQVRKPAGALQLGSWALHALGCCRRHARMCTLSIPGALTLLVTSRHLPGSLLLPQGSAWSMMKSQGTIAILGQSETSYPLQRVHLSCCCRAEPGTRQVAPPEVPAGNRRQEVWRAAAARQAAACARGGRR